MARQSTPTALDFPALPGDIAGQAEVEALGILLSAALTRAEPLCEDDFYGIAMATALLSAAIADCLDYRAEHLATHNSKIGGH